MRLTGPNVFGPPRNRADAVAVLREAVDRGVDHIDTAQYYGPDVVNELIREALHPYPPELVLVSKVGARRTASGGIEADDAPPRLRQVIQETLAPLGVAHLPIVNLRVMRGSAADEFFEDQLGAMEAARTDGLIERTGLSNVTLDQLLLA